MSKCKQKGQSKQTVYVKGRISVYSIRQLLKAGYTVIFKG